jgi:hypothetical protein
MLLIIFEVIKFSVLLFFGIYVSAAFLGIILNKKTNLVFLLFGAGNLLLQMLSHAFLGMEYTEMVYPLITHLPLLLLFMICFKRKLLPSLSAILSAYLCCQISKWIGLLVLSVSHETWIMDAARILVTMPIWYGIVRYAARPLQVILNKTTKELLIFGILPLVYYVFDYFATVYTNLLYKGSQAVFEFLPFVLCIAYLLFNVVYVKEYEKECAAEHQKKLIEIQTAHSMKEIEEIKRSKYEISLFRHDMRHFLSNVSAMIGNNDYDKAQEYIQGIIQLTDQTVIRKYCENELVNMILSTYDKRMADKGIRFDAVVAIPAELPCSELAFTSILSNGLENAINAVSELSEESRIICLKLSMKNDKLLLSIQNAFATRPVFVNGLPVTNMTGHGLGTQSIQYITAKLNGSCQFTADDRLFSLRVVL